MTTAPISSYDHPESLLTDLVDAFLSLANESIRARGVFRVSLSGGTTPQRLYEAIAGADLDFSRIQWFWGDERNVPPDHVDSNFRMVEAALLDPASIDRSTVFPVPVDVDAPANAALAYESTLKSQFLADDCVITSDGQVFPAWDLVLLGLGGDAHTASLFPETTALDVCDRWFVENWVEKFAAYRYTLTAPAINSGRQIWFLVSGAGKRSAVAQVLGNERNVRLFPAQLIKPTRFFITSDAVPF